MRKSMVMALKHLTKVIFVGYLLAFLGILVSGDCVDDGVCALHEYYHYKTLDGTPRDETSKGCQDYYLPIPADWTLVGWTTAGRHVAGLYNWGTSGIMHSTSSGGYMTNTRLYSGYLDPNWRISTSSDSDGETTYKCSACNLRILIRQLAPVNCSRGDGLPVVFIGGVPQCSACLQGYMSDGGMDALCLPTLAHEALRLISSPPSGFQAEHDEFGIVRLSLFASVLPEVLYESVKLVYAINVQPNESSLDLRGISPCQQNYWSSTTIDNETSFKAVLTYSDLYKDCFLGFNATTDMVERTGVVGVALIITDEDGAFERTLETWHFPINVQLPASIGAIYNDDIMVAGSVQVHNRTIYNAKWADSILILYESDKFQATKQLHMYQAGEQAFAELTLTDAPGVVLTLALVWISETPEPAQDMLHNLTDSIVVLGHGSAGNSQVRFSVPLQPCVSCFIHVVGEISIRRLGDAYDDVIEGRQLLSSLQRRIVQSVQITVNEGPSANEDLPVGMKDVPSDSGFAHGGGWEDRVVLRVLMVLSFAMLFVTSATCYVLGWLRAKLGAKYMRITLNDPEAAVGAGSPEEAPQAPAR